MAYASTALMTVPFTVLRYETIGSTNTEARRLAAGGAPHGTVVHALEQAAGRGKASAWFSPPGNLYVSILLRTGLPPRRNTELSFLSALALADTLDALLPGDPAVTLKWPNDVLVDGGKIAGILLEHTDDSLVAGIGLNLLHAPVSPAYATTTVAAHGGTASVDVARDVLVRHFARRYDAWRANGFGPTRFAWCERSWPSGAEIHVRSGADTVSGMFAGLDLDGALLLDTASGRRRIVAGDVRA
jgi:BirA family biotin operon repressor/biotin-[acetyl-CoA-carboxylase] ligase